MRYLLTKYNFIQDFDLYKKVLEKIDIMWLLDQYYQDHNPLMQLDTLQNVKFLVSFENMFKNEYHFKIYCESKVIIEGEFKHV